MSRPLRMEFAGAFYHVTSRGDQRGSICVTDHDRAEFLATLARIVELYGWRVHAWCQMTNHYHLLNENYLGSEQLVHGLLARVDEQVSVCDTPKVQRRALLRPLDEYADRYHERDDAIAAACWSGSYTLQQIGAHFGVHYWRVSRIIRVRRDVPARDEL